MKSILLNYLKSFWSPEKVVLLVLLISSYCINTYHAAFYQNVCFTGEGLRNSPCSEKFLDLFYTPLATVDNELVLFFFLLLILPLPILQSWAKYIASWSIPLGILIYLSGIPNEPGSGSMFSSAFNAASRLSIAVMLWLWLLAAFVVYQIFRAMRSHFNQK